MAKGLATAQNAPNSDSRYLPWNSRMTLLQTKPRYAHNERIIDNGNLIKKSNFPRICLPLIVVLSAALNFAIVMAIYLVFLALIGHWPGLPLLAVVPLLLLQTAFAAALGVLLGTLNVFFRDVGQFTGVVLQFWFWLTPIASPRGALPIMRRELCCSIL